MHAPRQSYAVTCLTTIYVLFFFFFFFWEMLLFLEYFVPFIVVPPLSMESTLYVFLPDGVFLPFDHGPDFLHRLII